MKRTKKTYVVVLLAILAIVWLVAGQCGNKEQPESKTEKWEIWENRTDGYLERVAADAELTYRQYQERYDTCHNNPEKFDSTKIKALEKDMDEMRNVQSAIAYYQRLLRIPSKERTEEENKTLERVYSICRKMERDGWGWNTSMRLVDEMKQLERK